MLIMCRKNSVTFDSVVGWFAGVVGSMLLQFGVSYVCFPCMVVSLLGDSCFGSLVIMLFGREVEGCNVVVHSLGLI